MRMGRGVLSVELGFWNPLYALGPLILLSISLPLAIFAGFTTSLAISLLFCRAAVVYVQLAVALVGSWFESPSLKTTAIAHRSPHAISTERASPHSQRNRRRSFAGSTSSQDGLEVTGRRIRLPDNSASFATFLGTSETTRDFEGVGGWRAPGNEDEEALWMGLNSRLQLPLDTTHTRRHKRSLTGGTSDGQRWSWSPEASRVSPAHSRARTPIRLTMDTGDDYFHSHSSIGDAPEGSKHHQRRKSGSGSSSSSTASGIVMSIKEDTK